MEVERTLTARQANIAWAVAVSIVGWDTHYLFDLVYDSAVDGVLEGARSFDADRFRDDQLDGWLVWMAKREAYSVLSRRRKRKVKQDHVPITDLVEDASPFIEKKDPLLSPPDGLIEGEEWDFLRKAISTLSESEQRDLFQYFGDGVHREYTQALGISRQAVYDRIRKIIKRLRSMAERECLL